MPIMGDILDLIIPSPAQFGRIGWRSEPPCNGGNDPKKQQMPPAPPAPTRTELEPEAEAQKRAKRRNGLEDTIMNAPPRPTLAVPAKLGGMGGPAYGGEA